MGKTSIEWADYSANSWRGCSRIALGCTHCYAATLATRFPATFGRWGTEQQWGVRVVADLDKLFKQVRGWNQRAADANALDQTYNFSDRRPPIVFWNDASDTFEDWHGALFDRHGDIATAQLPPGVGTHRDDPICLSDVRRRMFAEGIDENQNLTHVLLTKRPENVRKMWVEPEADAIIPDFGNNYLFRENVWLLYSASDQATLEAGLPHLLACRDLVPVLGLSLEPLLGPVTIPHFVDWIIVGGESGPNARPCNVEWIRSIVRQCRNAGVPCFVKQLGANVIDANSTMACSFPDSMCWPDGFVQDGQRIRLRDSKGGNTAEWPEDLRIQEFPR